MSSMPATDSGPDCSLVVPVFRNEENIPELLERLASLHAEVPGGIEVVCVVDGSPDRSYALLAEALARAPHPSRLLALSRNFGSFAAIREGLRAAGGTRFAVMSADLQEPRELFLELFARLGRDEADVILATREGRGDPWMDRAAAGAFWGAYRQLVQPEVPPGGVDVFGCNRAVRDALVGFSEARSSLVGQLVWLGFRRALAPYRRLPRRHGRSAWTIGRKIAYLQDSVFSFSDLPVRLLTLAGALGLVAAAVFGAVVVAARLTGAVSVPGYSALVVTILFFAGLNMLGLGIIGSYVWRAYENTKSRPLAIVMSDRRYGPGSAP